MPAGAGGPYCEQVNSNSRVWRQPPAWAVDVAVAVVVAAAVLAGAVWPRPAGSGQGSGPLVASLLAAASAAALLLRRRWPLPVLAATVAATIAWFALGYNIEGQYLRSHLIDLAFLVALYTVASRGDRRRSLLVGAVLVVVMAVTIALVTGQGVGNVLVAAGIGWVLVPLLLGEVVRSRREYLAMAKEQALREERLRIARELHDVMAHSIAMINVQAGVAARVIDRQPDEARQALLVIKQASREALREVRATLGVLRRGDQPHEGAPRQPEPGLARLDALLSATRSAAWTCAWRFPGRPGRCPRWPIWPPTGSCRRRSPTRCATQRPGVPRSASPGSRASCASRWSTTAAAPRAQRRDA